jgi:hypothetical protein
MINETKAKLVTVVSKVWDTLRMMEVVAAIEIQVV